MEDKKVRLKQLHRIYEESKIFVETAPHDVVGDIEDETEKLFYVAMCDFFLQQWQKEVVEKRSVLTRKEYLVFGGVNGAGKSTLYATYKYAPRERVNSDEILKENGGDWRNSTDQAKAMKEAVGRINEYFNKGVSFNQETTLTGRTIINHIRRAREQGYYVKLCYVGLDSADLALERIAQRVAKGGHGIPEADVRRRYEQSLENLKEIIPICDEVNIYDNTHYFTCVAHYDAGKISFRKECEWLDKHIQ